MIKTAIENNQNLIVPCMNISHVTGKYNKIQKNPINENLLIGFQDQVAEKPYFKPFSECIHL